MPLRSEAGAPVGAISLTRLGGGGIRKVARHGTAALLNATHPAVDYPLSVAEVIAAVQDGDVKDIADFNELSSACPAED